MKRVVKVISVIFILLLFYATRNSDILSLTVSFGMYLLIGSVFSGIKIKDKSISKFICLVISIITLFIPITVISYLIGDIMNIPKLSIINVIMSFTLMFNIIFNSFREYLGILGYKKIYNNISDIRNIVFNILGIILLVLMMVFDVKSYIVIILLYCINIFVSIVMILLMFRYLPKINKKKFNIGNIFDVKDILIGDKIKIIYNVISGSYVYISIIVLYYVLLNRYNYGYDNVSLYVSNTYFYGLIVMYFIYKYLKKYLNIDYKGDFNFNINKIIRVVLPLFILMIILSKSFSNIIFGSNNNIFISVIPILFVYLFYDFVMNVSIINNKYKKVILALIIGLIIKIIFELPLIDSVSRIGYSHSLELGSTLSIVLGLVVSIILGIIFIKNKLKISLLDNFNNLLNIVYENIIYTIILVLFTFVIEIHPDTFLESVMVVLFYLIITVMFYCVKRFVVKK